MSFILKGQVFFINFTTYDWYKEKLSYLLHLNHQDIGMKKILAIDDNTINLELVGQILKIHFPEFQYISCFSGVDGIKMAKTELPEIILLDILMPEMNGYEVCEILKSDKKTHNIPVIMISALGNDPLERTKGLNVGADIFIAKPFNQYELKAHINVVLRIKKAEDLLRKRNESLELSIKAQTKKYLQSEKRFRQISENAKEFYWEIDSNGIFTYISPIIEKTLDIKPDEIIGIKDYLHFFQLNRNDLKKNKIKNAFIDQVSFKDFEIELKLENRKNRIWLAVSGIAVFKKNKDFYGFKGVCYDITKYKQSEFALKKNVTQIENYQKRLKDLNTELILIEENEKRRIAENVHDSLGQSLSLAYIKLSSITENNLSQNEKKIILETSDLINQAIKESRNITYDLCPPILHELGLISALNWRMDQIEENFGIKTKLISTEVRIEIQKEYNIFIYRIINELFANIIKHAYANLIILEIKKWRKLYYFKIEDNGVGFKTKMSRIRKSGTRENGFGLLSIMERLDNINGKFIIDSKPGKGTKATIIIPYNENITL